MSGNDTEEDVSAKFEILIDRTSSIYLNHSECKINCFSFCIYFVFGKCLYNLCFKGVKEKLSKERTKLFPIGMPMISY